MDAAADGGASSDDSSSSRSRHNGIKRQRRDTIDTGDEGLAGSQRHQCPHCDRSFGRVEHMKRHAASHSSQRPFVCSACNKGFHRLDTMQRHELIHREKADATKPKGARACVECAAAKVRCAGGQPCSRCEAKAANCVYPDAGRNRLSDATSPPPPEVTDTSVAEVAPTFSPNVWSEAPISPPQWLPPPPPPILRSEVPTRPSPGRHQSFSSVTSRPVDMYQSMRPAEMLQTPHDETSPMGSGTRNWLETLLGPQSMDIRTIASPDTGGSHKTTSVSETYLDGDGARLPKIGIRRRYNFRPSLPLPPPGPVPVYEVLAASYVFPQGFCQPTLEHAMPEHPLLNEITYNDIRRNFEHTCGPHAPFSPGFLSPDYPTWDHMHLFIQIYLDEFQPLVPMLHVPTLDLNSSHWLLALALASMGSHFADMPEAEYCALALNEHLRRAIYDLLESTQTEGVIDPTLFAQVKLLNCIGMTYCGDDRMEKFGWRQHSDLIKFCKTHWVNEEDSQAQADAHPHVDIEWRQWRDIEARRRTGYAIWLLDCMWNYGYQERNLLCLEDAKVPVPCQEVIWEAESALQWQHVKAYSVPMPSLNAATHAIYIEKRVEPTMGEFSRILLLHALYSACWSIQSHFSNPLSHWIPRASKQELRSLPAFQEPIFLPAEPSYFRWRNATCDCLDILHWRANSVTGASSGVEHPTLLHLHLARIILLTPFREICTLAFGLTGINMNVTAVPPSPSDIAAARALIRRWAEQDQHKARLAMYHAGVLFWHVRLYSAKGAYEPTAVLLAALALWAFGTFAPKTPTVASPMASLDALGEEEAFPFPTSINIDRPADDEIVQMYIRRGDRMQALIVGVGDIRSPLGPPRVLLEGAKLVSSLANWGSSRRVMSVLITLARISRETGVAAAQ